MLAAKKLDKKKIIIYSIVLSLLFIAIIYLIYANFFSNSNGSTTATNILNIIKLDSNKNEDLDITFDENELQFLDDPKFTKLRSNNGELIIEESISNDPFKFKPE